MADIPTLRVCWQLQPRMYFISSDSEVNKTYRVYLGYGIGQVPWCECLGFNVVKPDPDGIKRCKHIRRLETGRCTYTEALDGPPRPNTNRCPKCGGHTVLLFVPHV